MHGPPRGKSLGHSPNFYYISHLPDKSGRKKRKNDLEKKIHITKKPLRGGDSDAAHAGFA
jgi:hypothetical protein